MGIQGSFPENYGNLTYSHIIPLGFHMLCSWYALREVREKHQNSSWKVTRNTILFLRIQNYNTKETQTSERQHKLLPNTQSRLTLGCFCWLTLIAPFACFPTEPPCLPEGPKSPLQITVTAHNSNTIFKYTTIGASWNLWQATVSGSHTRNCQIDNQRVI